MEFATLRLFALSLALAAWLPMAAFAEVYLLMAEQKGCQYCRQWDAQIAHVYPKTPEGRAAPLRRYDIHEDVPAGVTLDGNVRFTPTFVLIRDGREIDRLEGYPGEDFFWGLLGAMLSRAGIDPT